MIDERGQERRRSKRVIIGLKSRMKKWESRRRIGPNYRKRDPGPGTRNKITTALKDVILGALSDAGGQAWLVEQTRKNPVAFMALIGRVLPLQVKDIGANPIGPRPPIHVHVPWRDEK